MRWPALRQAAAHPPIPSPNIWIWPDVYERENAAQDVEGAIWAALHGAVPWAGLDVLDVGCGDGFHLPVFAERAASVIGVEPHPPLVKRARDRIADLDATVAPYGTWMRADIPHYDPVTAERFFAGQGFTTRRVATVWRFPDRATCEAVLRIEFSRTVADQAIATVPDVTIPVGYRLHVRVAATSVSSPLRREQ
ncbi:MAG: class I SAM-dependent methyltransferase [Pseudonocardia sp.]